MTALLEWGWTAMSVVGIGVHVAALKDAYLDQVAVRRGLFNGPRNLVARRQIRAEWARLYGQAAFLALGVLALLTPDTARTWTPLRIITVMMLVSMQIAWVVSALLDRRDNHRLIVLYEKERG